MDGRPQRAGALDQCHDGAVATDPVPQTTFRVLQISVVYRPMIRSAVAVHHRHHLATTSLDRSIHFPLCAIRRRDG
ncbi:MAG: hypothetical protein V1723_04125 [Candidatus Uhrbacteria bacterium]